MATTANADERRQLIISTAARLFNDNGYYQTSMEDIANAVGLRKPTLYWYVSGKEEILFLIHNAFVDRLTASLTERQQSGLGCLEQLRLAAGDMFAQITELPGYVRSFHEHSRELSGEMLEQTTQKRDDYFRMIVELLRRGMDEGELAPGDPVIIAMALFGMCNWVYKWYRPDGPLSSEQIAQQFWDIFMQGISNKAAD